MAAHYLAHDLSDAGVLHTHAKGPLQDVKAHDSRELGLDQLLIPLYRQHSDFQCITVSAFRSISSNQH